MSQDMTQSESKTNQEESADEPSLNGVVLEDKKSWSGSEIRAAIRILKNRKAMFGLNYRSNRLLRWLESVYRAKFRTPSSETEHVRMDKAEEKRERRRLRNLRNRTV